METIVDEHTPIGEMDLNQPKCFADVDTSKKNLKPSGRLEKKIL
jgi:hypothetical protein